MTGPGNRAGTEVLGLDQEMNEFKYAVFNQIEHRREDFILEAALKVKAGPRFPRSLDSLTGITGMQAKQQTIVLISFEKGDRLTYLLAFGMIRFRVC